MHPDLPLTRRAHLVFMLARHEVAPADGFAPSPFRLTGGRTTVIPRWYLIDATVTSPPVFKIGRWSWNCANLSGSSDPRTSLYAIQRKNLRAGGVAPPLFTQRAWFYRPGRHIWQSPRTHEKNGRAGGTCTRNPLLPGQVRWLLRYSPKFVPGHRLHPIPLGP